MQGISPPTVNEILVREPGGELIVSFKVLRMPTLSPSSCRGTEGPNGDRTSIGKSDDGGLSRRPRSFLHAPAPPESSRLFPHCPLPLHVPGGEPRLRVCCPEREQFVQLLRKYERFCGVCVITDWKPARTPSFRWIATSTREGENLALAAWLQSWYLVVRNVDRQTLARFTPMEKVWFTTAESGDDLVLAFAVRRHDAPSEIESLIMIRTTRLEFIFEEHERGVKVSFDRYVNDEADLLKRFDYSASDAVVRIQTTLRVYELDIREVDGGEVREMCKLLKKMNFDQKFMMSGV